MTVRRVLAGVVGALAACWLLLQAGPVTGEPLRLLVAEPEVVPRAGQPAAEVALATRVEAATVAPIEVEPPEWAAARAMYGADVVLGMVDGHVAGDDGEVLGGAFVRAVAESGQVHAARTGPDGRFRFVLPEGRVVLSAARYDGVEVQGPDELVLVSKAESTYVPLALLSGPAASAGVSVVEHPDGFEVLVVGRLAAEAGLQRGMVMRRIDGQDALSLTPEAAERLLVGREGSEVVVEVSGPKGDVQDLVWARMAVDRSLQD